MNTILLLLALVGSLTGIKYIWMGIKWIYKTVRHYRASGEAPSKDYYFSEKELAIRWQDNGLSYIALKRLNIVANRNNVDVCNFSLGPSWVGEFSVTSMDTDVAITKPPNTSLHDENMNYTAHLPRPLKRGDTYNLTLIIHATANPGNSFPKHLSSYSPRRTDELILRVAFTTTPSGNVTYKRIANDDRVMDLQHIDIDPINNESRVVIQHPIVGSRYMLEWNE